jgi:hypothetical protein
MATIHFIAGKGGSGKTTVSRGITEYLEINNRDFELVDADSALGDVKSVYSRATLLTLSDNPHRYAEPDVIFNQALKKTVLVNLPNTLKDIKDWFERTGLLGLGQEHGVSFLCWFVTDGSYMSIKLFQESLETFKHGIPHLLVRNKGRLNGLDFSYLDQDETYQQAIASPNLVKVIDFPELGSAEQYFIDGNSLTLREAQELIKDEKGIIPAQRIRTFIDTLSAALDQVDFDAAMKIPEIAGEAAVSLKKVRHGKTDLQPEAKPETPTNPEVAVSAPS